MRVVAGEVWRQTVLVSGLILFAFAAAHFLNHAMGLYDLAAMYEVQRWRLAVTRSWPGAIVLGLALIIHVVVACAHLATRTTLRLPGRELALIGLGLAIPLLLLPHIIDTRMASAVFGVRDDYLYVLARLWPAGAIAQSLLLLIVWIHGCIGIDEWLRFRPSYRRMQPLLLFFAIAIPLAALAGFMVSGRAVAAFMSDPAMAERTRQVTHWPSVGDDAQLRWYRVLVRIAVIAGLVALAGVMVLRRFAMMAAPKIFVSYAGGPKVQSAVGPTLLEISRAAGVPHSAECGGRARCGTCRVRIQDGAATLDPPSAVERATLASFDGTGDARLACEIRPRASLAVTRLVRTGEAAALAAPETAEAAGTERPLCLLYLRILDFNALTRDHLPYDAVFVLNEFFAAASAAIEQQHGWVDKFYGDGLLAVFGQSRGAKLGCGDAVLAVRAIDLALDRLNERLAAELGQAVRCAAGIHSAHCLLGRVNWGKGSSLTILGAGPDIAAGLSAIAETNAWQIAISAEAATPAGVLDQGQRRSTELATGDAGRITMDVIGIGRARELATATDSTRRDTVTSVPPV